MPEQPAAKRVEEDTQSRQGSLYVTDEVQGQPRPVPAVMRASAILDYIAAQDRPVSISDLARALKLPKSSVHGLCHTLSGLSLLRLTADGRFCLGGHMMHWVNAYLEQNSLVDEFYRLLDGDPSLNNFTVTLSALNGAEVIYLACRNSPRPLGVTFRIGMKLPAVFSATGKAMLACLPETELQPYLNVPWPRALTSNSVKSAEKLREELQVIEQRGYSLDNGQIREGMICLGAAIFNARGGVEAGIALSMTSGEAKADVIESVAQGVMRIAKRLSQRIGVAF